MADMVCDQKTADILAVWLHYGCSMIDNHKMVDMVCDQKTADILAVWLHYGCSMFDNHKMAGISQSTGQKLSSGDHEVKRLPAWLHHGFSISQRTGQKLSSGDHEVKRLPAWLHHGFSIRLEPDRTCEQTRGLPRGPPCPSSVVPTLDMS
ncbi:hypothetical protein RRG08_045139 [Elysia crispata]|uniref:Uncharacterized protein n=1 Tax=Elysia crispata TaxID=231223 RepID=A0AAE1D4Y4_9GAST|nr:hypothetical protein RRG08_045139 [Elysia crispata]